MQPSQYPQVPAPAPSRPGSRQPRPGARPGSALVIVLALIVLITGLALAFFSRALLERQISDSSASQEKISTFAAGSIDQIEGDLKQEIVDSSVVSGTAVLDGTTLVPVYAPNLTISATNGSPCRVTGTAVVTGTNVIPPNIVKISSYNQPFFAFNTAGGATVATGPNRASPALTTGTSLNGRHMTPARWNAALLMPILSATSTTDYTPVPTFSTPNWILVERNGSNYIPTPSTPISSSVLASSSNATSVIGRYAYVIYNEGGLIDINVAGSPSASANGVQPPLSTIPSYKSALAFADLTQIPGLSQSAIDQIVGWRNYASSQLSGSFPYNQPVFNVTTTSTYYTSVLSNTTGFLTVNETMPAGQTTPAESDKVFPSRQALMSFLLNGLATNNPALTGSLQTALQYLGTFTRDLNQPSYTPNPNRPAVLDNPVTNGGGGNDAHGFDVIASNPATAINPPFLAVTGTTSFNRNDGTMAVPGEPLVKKRFALSRLAWLTCHGPIAGDSGTLNPNNDTTIASVISILENQYGYSPTFLEQGGPTNIYKYFGLSWVQDNRQVGAVPTGDGQSKWLYNHSGTSFLTNAQPAPGGAILRLSGVTSLNPGREADFVELLKAALCAGSLAKGGEDPYPNTGAANTYWKPYDWQFQRDVSLDNAVIQVFANIIEQFKPDGYPVRILFDNSSTSTITPEFCGSENLPYVYRVQKGMLQVHQPNPTETTPVNNQPANSDNSNGNIVPYTTGTCLTDPGVGVDIAIPTIWNPYDPNSSRGAAYSNTPLYPTQFRFIMDSATDPDHVDAKGNATNYPSTYSIVNYCGGGKYSGVAPEFTASNEADLVSPLPQVSSPPTWNQLYTPAGYKPAYSPIFANGNAELDFQVPVPSVTSGTSLFSEPTTLIRAGYPTGSSLVSGSMNMLLNDPALIAYRFSTSGTTPVGIWSEVDDPLNIAPAVPGGGTSQQAHNSAEKNKSQGYVGIELGAYPLRWVEPLASGTTKVIVPSYGANNSPYNSNLIAILQCQDASGNWINYNVTFLAGYLVGGSPTTWHYSTPTYGSAMQNRTQMVTNFDPRTSRFGPVATDTTSDIPPNDTVFAINAVVTSTPAAYTWLGSSPLQGVNASNRPDAFAGFGIGANFLTTWEFNAGWHPGKGSGTNFGSTDPIRLGAFSQNNINAYNDGTLYSGVPLGPGVGSVGHGPQYYADPDGVVRRAMGAYVPCGTSVSAVNTIGLPMARTMPMVTGGSTPPAFQSQSRPMMLHRPFRSVAELGYVFSGTPWKNLDFFTPGSGDSALLDVYCINDTSDPNGLVAGKVDLNTRQPQVLQAVISGAYVDEEANQGVLASGTLPALTDGTGSFYNNAFPNTVLATATNLVARTSQVPLNNIADLVGRYTATTVPSWGNVMDEFAGYAGFVGTDPSNPTDSLPTLNSVPLFTPNSSSSPSLSVNAMGNIQRFRETPIRALANAGTARVWNLMIDLVAQTGRYPKSATTLDNFEVEGEKRYWAHIAIDRATGQVIAKQIEVVKE